MGRKLEGQKSRKTVLARQTKVRILVADEGRHSALQRTKRFLDLEVGMNNVRSGTSNLHILKISRLKAMEHKCGNYRLANALRRRTHS